MPVKDYMLDVLPGMDRRKLSEIDPAYAQSLVGRPHLIPWVRHTLTFDGVPFGGTGRVVGDGDCEAEAIA